MKELILEEDEQITSKKSAIKLCYSNGKLAVVNFVTFQVDSTGKAAEDNFFASVDSFGGKANNYIMPIILAINGTPQFDTTWMENSEEGEAYHVKDSIDSFPIELQPLISKGVNETNSCLSKEFKDFTVVASGDSSFEKEYEATKDALKSLSSQIKKHRFSGGDSPLEQYLERYKFKKHLLIQGEKGIGKTYKVDEMFRTEGIETEFIAGHEGIESVDLLGYYTKCPEGNLVWMDGALTAAFRKAQTQKIGLFFDETLRVPARELNILVGALTPSSKNTYRLRTNRMVNVVDGIAETETLEIPMENLWCIGTTNVGAGYEVDEIDSALGDRFRVVNKTTDLSEIEDILNYHLSRNKALASSPDLVNKSIEFYTQVKDLQASGELEKVVNLRHLSETMQMCEDESEFVSYFYDLLPTWCSTDTDGQPNKAEKEIVGKLIKKIFKA
ncbi:MAG: AAA family ATPase [Poseidonibacter sp.]